MVTRRAALLAILAAPMADVRILARSNRDGSPAPALRGVLTIPLDQWSALAFTHEGQTVELSPSEIFNILRKA